MIFLLILSFILIWVQLSSLRFLVAAKNNSAILDNAEKLEQEMPEKKDISLKSLPVLFSLGTVISLNLIEIAYFVVCVYVFADLITKIGSSIMVGYSIYSLIKFIPRVKKFFQKPAQYLRQKTQGFERKLNLVMASIEIVFCSYILIKTLIKYKVF
ncbi:MAG: hypothetical protein K9H14_03970 [Actinomycetia bacterium]|nr:hypothetical protein [Actinomycetes bacterium]